MCMQKATPYYCTFCAWQAWQAAKTPCDIHRTKSKTFIWLIKSVSPKLAQMKRLPTLHEALALFFFCHKDQRL